MVGRQHRAGERKGAEDKSHIDSTTHTHTHSHTNVCILADLQSYTVTCSRPLPLLTQTLGHVSQETEGEALPPPSDTTTSAFSNFLDCT